MYALHRVLWGCLLLFTVTHDKQRAACTMNTSISDWSVCVCSGWAPANLVSEQVGTAQIGVAYAVVNCEALPLRLGARQWVRADTH